PEKTKWSKEVKVPARTSFYVNGQISDQRSPVIVKFEVFTWQGGAKKSKVFDVAPGDMIGKPDEGVDFSTGWTLVDIARDARKNTVYALLTDPEGNIYKRDFNTDQANPDYKNDKAAVGSAAASSPPPPVAEGR